MSFDWPAIAMPTSLTIDSNSSTGMFVRKPSIDSSLSIVPPVKPRPRPESFATFSPHAATTGQTTRLVLSPTPPVEC